MRGSHSQGNVARDRLGLHGCVQGWSRPTGSVTFAQLLVEVPSGVDVIISVIVVNDFCRRGKSVSRNSTLDTAVRDSSSKFQANARNLSVVLGASAATCNYSGRRGGANDDGAGAAASGCADTGNARGATTAHEVGGGDVHDNTVGHDGGGATAGGGGDSNAKRGGGAASAVGGCDAGARAAMLAVVCTGAAEVRVLALV